MIRNLFIVFSLCLALGLGACETTQDQPVDEQPAGELYSKARSALEEENYVQATALFEELERLHPYSELATQAQLMSAYASYLDQRYDEAIIALDRFIELHPGHEDVAYAHYLKALSYYEQISDVRRDQDMTRQALDALNTLIRLYPDSKYPRDAQLKRDLTIDHLAGKQMEIGRYYLERGHINAAIKRFTTVVEDYQTTSHIPEALHRLVESYLTLGLKQEAKRVAAVLGHNYPGSKWYERSYKLLDEKARQDLLEEKGTFERTVDSLFAAE